MRCVAVYSDADAHSPHVQLADQAVHIGAAVAAESYLDGEKIIQAALFSGAEAIHPGYGFLSENAQFARAVTAAGLVFIGPPPEAIEVMGDKAVSKRAMMAANVPCVPGYQGEDQSNERLLAEVDAVGFPLMVKAAAGGGGRGMRLVNGPDEIESALKQARSEAENAFGNGDLILERAIMRPRHVEIQVFADQCGNVIHLGERDCSVQRRHQKVIEESPCPVMTPQLREQMGEAAVEAARAVDYVGAGTVEFLLDESGEFYFLEMNTRLQVEHPVTEMVTGLDLVQMQLAVAQGLPLPLEQSQVALNGSAIEVRLYAEDPALDFLPSTGAIDLWSPPGGEGIRVDAGIVTGSEVSPYYDSMVAKIIAWGETRAQARRRLLRALDKCVLVGPANNRDFLLDALRHPTFAQGDATTAFVGEAYPEGVSAFAPGSADLAGAAVTQYILTTQAANDLAVAVPPELREWSSTADLTSVTHFDIGGEQENLTIRPRGKACYYVTVGDDEHVVVVQASEPSSCRMEIDGTTWAARYNVAANGHLHFIVAGAGQFSVSDVRSQGEEEGGANTGPFVRAPMHGLVLEVSVTEGDRVEAGDPLITLEAMKMQHAITASISGVVTTVTATADKQVNAGELLLEILPAEDKI
jgi:geranyl-CoA carboxylase alpha subunit